jgi:TonB-linked SusC/RagA family outer membrane protein
MRRKSFSWKTVMYLSLCCIFFLFSVGIFAQNNVIVQGQILDDANREALIGVSVKEKGTSNGTITDINGKYSLRVNPNATVVFSYIGYLTVEVKATEVQQTILLKEDTKTLDEVVVVGYGVQRKVNLTGAVSAVKIDEAIASRSISNVSSGLAGFVPGLIVSQSTGFAGANGASLKIRGLGSINGADPLIVVDGMPDVDINRININDVESISVLKDAASSAIYGSRAANGVILITTKSGMNESKSKVSYTGSYAASSPVEFYDYLADYSRALQMQLRASATGNQNSNFRQGTVEQWMSMSLVDPVLYPNTDQFDEMFRTAIIQNHTVSASGGSDKYNFYASVGIMDEEGLQIHNDYTRYNYRLNLDYKIRDNIKIGFKTDGSWTDNNIPRGSGLENAGLRYAVSGVLNRHPETGEYGGAMAYGENTAAGNVQAEYEAYKTKRERKEYNGNAYIEWSPIKGLRANVSYALRYYNQFSKSLQNPLTQWNFQTGQPARMMPDQGGDGLTDSTVDGHKTLFQGRLNYDKEIFSGHRIAAMFVAAEEFWFQRDLSAWRRDRLHPTLEELNAASAASQTNSGSSYSEGLRSFIGRLNYTAYDKYLLELNFRYDGSSRFSKGHQYGFFPSAAVGWRLSEENFFLPLKNIVNNAKLRVSIGSLGNNSGVGRYEQKETLATTNYIVDGSIAQGFSANKMINKNLTWESTRVFNIGLDMGFFNNQLTAELDWYDRFTKDMIRGSSISSLLSGYSAPRINVADLRNRGVEVNLTWRSKVAELEYSINLNGSYNVSKLEKWGDYLAKGWEAVDMPYRFLYVYDAYPGLVQSWGQIYDAPYQGTYIAPGDILRRDLNGDGQVTSEDRKAWEDRYRQTPLGQFGINLSASYKGFDLQALFQGSYGRWDVWLDDLNNVNVPADRYAFQVFHWNDTWTLDNRGASLPRLVTGSGGSNREESTFWAQQTSYIRLKNLQLGYSVPTKLLQLIPLNRTRIFVSAENLFTVTGWKGIDPEKNHDWDAYPLVKTYSVGINIEF